MDYKDFENRLHEVREAYLHADALEDELLKDVQAGFGVFPDDIQGINSETWFDSFIDHVISGEHSAEILWKKLEERKEIV